jgi:transpeptidase family protein/penicillin-binding protein
MALRDPSSPAGAGAGPRRPRLPSRVPDARRLTPLLLLAALAALAGLVAGARHQPSERRMAARYAAAWQRGDWAGMHALLSSPAAARVSAGALRRTYAAAAATLSLERVRVGAATGGGDRPVRLPVRLDTRLWGTLAGRLTVPVAPQADGEPGVDWRPNLVFPGLRRGEQLSRTYVPPARGAILARDGAPIARGPDRISGIGPAAADVAGIVGSAPADRAAALARRGFPAGARVGLNGLERLFDPELAGTPGGTLLAGRREVASRAPTAGRSVRTTIDPGIQAAAVSALAGRYGGIAVLRPGDGEVLGVAGIAFSAPQPPGSTFKIITMAGVLGAHLVAPGHEFPVQTAATLEGVTLANANGEACGGTLRKAFAESCNSVFAPLGARLGARRLVATAERFGFNAPPPFPIAAPSTLPQPGAIGDDLAVGSTAIGQGKVLATPLQMAAVAAAIAEDGRLPRPTLRKGAAPRPAPATSPRIASRIRRAMEAVVDGGTGAAAAVPGVRVAGKTGTAELRTTVEPEPDPSAPAGPAPLQEDVTDTDAWFTAFAPVRSPQVAVCVLLVGQGAGGATAAPAARPVIEAALGS